MDLYEEGDSRGDKGGGARAGEQCVFGCFHGFRAESTPPLIHWNHQPLYVVVVRGVAVPEDLDSERVPGFVIHFADFPVSRQNTMSA